MRKRNIIKLTLIREKTDTFLKLWVAPEIESVFGEAAKSQYGETDFMEKSNRWFDSEGKGLQFYKNTDEFERKLQGTGAFNNFGKALIDGDTGRVNIALLRVVGVSGKGGMLIKTNDLIGYEELKQYTENLASWVKDFYRDYIKKARLTATISLEV